MQSVNHELTRCHFHVNICHQNLGSAPQILDEPFAGGGSCPVGLIVPEAVNPAN